MDIGLIIVSGTALLMSIADRVIYALRREDVPQSTVNSLRVLRLLGFIGIVWGVIQ